MIQDAIDLGVRHAAQNICIGDIMRPAGSCPNPILFTHDGVEYTFDGDYLEKYDKRIKELSDNGADAIITDYPSIAYEVLNG